MRLLHRSKKSKVDWQGKTDKLLHVLENAF